VPLTPGTRVGAYEVVSLLGTGGMGEVYRSRDPHLQRDVALKILPDMFASDPERLARFGREAQVLATLNHPNIAQIYAVETSSSTRALVMELVEGETLADRIAKGPIPIDEALAIAKQIAEVLEAAHEQGIIHRDLKPANIKVREDGTVKVLDFGLAKLAEGAVPNSNGALTNSPTITSPAMMTGVGVLLGTAAYMSPEQAKGRPADKRSDIWAFGCVLYEMLTGKRAFGGEDVSDTLAAVLRGDPDWALLPGGTPPAIRLLIERCLVKDRRPRIADISTAQFVLAEASKLSPPAAASDIVPALRRRLWHRAMPLVAAVLVTGVLVGASVWRGRPSASPAPVTRFSFPLPEGQQFNLGSRRLVAISPDGTHVVYGANNRLFLRSLSEFEGHEIPGTESTSAWSPVFSPDGHSIAFYVLGENTIKRIATVGGVAAVICPADAPTDLSWTASSGIVFVQPGKGIFHCSPNGGTPQQLATINPNELVNAAQMLPGGKTLLFALANVADGAARWDKSQVVVQDVASGARKTIITVGSNSRYLESGHLLYVVGGVVFAVAFDPVRLAMPGEPAPVLEGVGRPGLQASGTADLDVSATGTLLYIPGPVGLTTAEQAVAIADRAGKVTRLSVPPGPYVHVRTSPDGGRLAIGTDDGKEAMVWIHDLAGTSAMRRLTFGGQNRFPIWSPDGQRVAFQSDREGDLAIYWQRADGTGSVERLTKPAQGETHVPESWSPDGTLVSFSVARESRFTLWTVSVLEKKAAPYGAVQSIEPIGSVFSPDGRWIAYTSTPVPGPRDSPNRGVYVQAVPVTGSRYQVPRQGLDFHPVWGPKGTELFYVPRTVYGELAVVSVTLQPSVTFGTPMTLPARVTGNRTANLTRAYDILPDGRFVGVVPASEPQSVGSNIAPHIRVAVNWLEELKARVPAK
jgi:serine/threonine-protein kinase